MSKFDAEIKGDSTLYSRYMDDLLRDIKSHQIDNKLIEINRLHPSLKFTVEHETDSSIPFLDIKIQRRNGKLTSEWFTKPTRRRIDHEFSRARLDEIQEIGCLRVGSSNSSLVQHVEAIS